jgi:hypothetical protein
MPSIHQSSAVIRHGAENDDGRNLTRMVGDDEALQLALIIGLAEIAQ